MYSITDEEQRQLISNCVEIATRVSLLNEEFGLLAVTPDYVLFKPDTFKQIFSECRVRRAYGIIYYDTAFGGVSMRAIEPEDDR